MGGELLACRLMVGGKGKPKGKSRGSALVVYKNEDEKQKALETMNDAVIDGHTIKVREGEKDAALDFSALAGDGDMTFLSGDEEDGDEDDEEEGWEGTEWEKWDR